MQPSSTPNVKLSPGSLGFLKMLLEIILFHAYVQI